MDVKAIGENVSNKLIPLSKKTRPGANVNAYLVLRKGENVLLHLRKNTGYCDNFYGLVSGHVEEGESETTAMIREAYEEAGVHLKSNTLKAAHVMHRKTDRFNVDIFFECSEWQSDVTSLLTPSITLKLL